MEICDLIQINLRSIPSGNISKVEFYFSSFTLICQNDNSLIGLFQMQEIYLSNSISSHFSLEIFDSIKGGFTQAQISTEKSS